MQMTCGCGRTFCNPITIKGGHTRSLFSAGATIQRKSRHLRQNNNNKTPAGVSEAAGSSVTVRALTAGPRTTAGLRARGVPRSHLHERKQQQRDGETEPRAPVEVKPGARR